MHDLESSVPKPVLSNARLRSRVIIFIVAFLTALSLIATNFFAYNSSLPQPTLPSLLPKTPSRTILILNVLSQITFFFLAEFTSQVLDATRWALACSHTGTSALTFLILSQATSVMGALYLSFGNNKMGRGRFERQKHRLWGGQRFALTLIRVMLAVVLLADVSFIPTYHELQQYPLLQSGLTEFNSSIVNDPAFQNYITPNFWWHFPALFSSSHAVAPTTCAGKDCKAFYFPAPMSLLKFPPNSPNITNQDSPSATTFIEKNSPGFQIEFSPIDTTREPPVTLDDCQVFGTPFLAFQLCLKRSNESILAAWNPCPYSVGRTASCLNTTVTSWRTVAQSSIKLTILKRHASTIFDRQNLTIIDITDLSPPTPVSYDPKDLFAIYRAVFKIDLNQKNVGLSTPYSLLLTVSGYLQSTGENMFKVMGGVAANSRLMAFLATPIIIYNDAWLGRKVSDPNMGNTLALATASYRLLISSTILYSFMIGGILSFLWCLIVIILTFTRVTPGTSFFPEIDVAAKFSQGANPELVARPPLSSDLSVGDSLEIRRAMARTKFYLQWKDPPTVEQNGTKETTALHEEREMPNGVTVG